ncbi:unnamed protein product [Phytophthora lilii]|uniref:Unnamed protein product n=1 Tax=Phytophthora lilii TaxID=2077276 RepID=A0A9W6TDQ8_9STRA|nr:unnamed protein product [Phytophthora lilii]
MESTGEKNTFVPQCQQLNYQEPVAKLARDAALEIFSGDIEAKMDHYARHGVLRVDAKSYSSSLKWSMSQSLLKWLLPHHGIAKWDYLSEGAYANVSRGMWFGAPVALKQLKKLDLDQCQALSEEVNILGGTLEKFCRHDGSTEKVWGYLHDAAVGLQGLHWHRVIHADLKCNNILISAGGPAKLIDFGLSCLETCDGGGAVGAYRWKAPECLNGEGPTFASDVFSFGMCVVQAISRRLPWPSISYDPVVKYNVTRGKLPKQPDCFSTLKWELVKRMCRFKPEERLDLDSVVKVLGFFANRSPYIDDQRIKQTLADWEREAQSPPVTEAAST